MLSLFLKEGHVHHLRRVHTTECASCVRTVERLTPSVTLIEVENVEGWPGLFYYRVGKKDVILPLEILCDERGIFQSCSYMLSNQVVVEAPQEVTQAHALPVKPGRPGFDLSDWPPGMEGFRFSDYKADEVAYFMGSSLLVCFAGMPASPVEWLYVAPSLHMAFDQDGRLTSVLFPNLSDEEIERIQCRAGLDPGQTCLSS